MGVDGKKQFVKVLFEYQATRPDELSIKTGGIQIQ
jgi:hypothetical protein